MPKVVVFSSQIDHICQKIEQKKNHKIRTQIKIKFKVHINNDLKGRGVTL